MYLSIILLHLEAVAIFQEVIIWIIRIFIMSMFHMTINNWRKL